MRGATVLSKGANPRSQEFQSTRPWGARPKNERRNEQWTNEFQSTRPWGARLACQYIQNGSCLNFNPRAHEGRDVLSVISILSISYFNPRAHEGRDPIPSPALFNFSKEISIHAPMRGATVVYLCNSRKGIISIHAPMRGATIIIRLAINT